MIGAYDGVYKNSFFLVVPSSEAKIQYFASLATDKYKRAKMTDNRVISGNDLIGARKTFKAVDDAIRLCGG